MKMITQIISRTIIIILLTSLFIYGQMSDYGFKRFIKSKSGWHKITLPDSIFSKVNSSLSDIRILGIVNNSDTIEAPYLLTEIKDSLYEKDLAFKLISTSNRNDEYYFTFQTAVNDIVNQIKLNFHQDNFNWIVTIEGSQDLVNWFTIKEDCRIISFKNPKEYYSYTTITLPDSKFKYYRIHFSSNYKPQLLNATFTELHKVSVNSKEYQPAKIKSFTDEKINKSIVEVDLHSILPISTIQLIVKDTFDFYRPVTIHFVSDSFNTGKGWNYIYNEVYSGILSSFEPQQFAFNTILSKRVKIEITNNDSEPLQIGKVEVNGNAFELTARFDKEAEYYLVYGNPNAVFPKYDIEAFRDKIPNDVSYLSIGDEKLISQDQKEIIKPFFENKLWLWLIMVFMILIIGWFSLSLIRKREQQ